MRKVVYNWIKVISARAGVFMFFIMAFEVMIMISPFAFFFYSVFSPFFNYLNKYALTAWLTNFYLPHMILPPTLLLKAIRISGSVLFVLGVITFIVCACQVYLGKLFKWGIANKGLYAYIRHPQYLALGIWGVGMAILWARFIVLVTLGIMFVLYYFLARDEESRMVILHGNSYKNYIKRTGMFFPKPFETFFNLKALPDTWIKNLSVSLAIFVIVISTGVLLRHITLNSIEYSMSDNVTVLSILPEDNKLAAEAISGIEKNRQKINFVSPDKSYFGYLMPVDYIMQGMIADTGEKSRLHKHHNTFVLIFDWVFHPFRHLRNPPSAQMAKMHGVDPIFARRHHCPLNIDNPNMVCDTCPYRRVILVEIGNGNSISGADSLSFKYKRIPAGYIDINTNTGEIINVQKVEVPTAWKDVPTPTI